MSKRVNEAGIIIIDFQNLKFWISFQFLPYYREPGQKNPTDHRADEKSGPKFC